MNDFINSNVTSGNLTASNDVPGGSDNPTVAQFDSGNTTSGEIDQSVDPVDNGPTDAYRFLDKWYLTRMAGLLACSSGLRLAHLHEPHRR